MSLILNPEISTRTDLPRVLFDTNVVLDVFLDRKPYIFDSAQAIREMVSLQQVSFISANSITDLFYILRKNLGSAQAAHDALDNILGLFEIADIDALDIYGAHSLGCKVPDFEDAVIAYAAARLRLKYVITRNTNDFKKLPVRAITPHEFLKVLDPNKP